MIEEIGTVKSINGMLALVDVPRKSSCEGCSAGTCKPEEKTMEIEALNRAGAAAGQRVRVLINPSAYLKGSMLVYGVPALSLVIGAVFGKEVVSGFYPKTDPDILSAVFGFAAFIVSFVAVKIFAGFSAKKTGSKPVIEEILS